MAGDMAMLWIAIWVVQVFAVAGRPVTGRRQGTGRRLARDRGGRGGRCCSLRATSPYILIFPPYIWQFKELGNLWTCHH